jgi:hypothetical protein
MLSEWKTARKVWCEGGICTVHESDLDELIRVVAQACHDICTDYSANVLKYSQFGSNAATDCANLIHERFYLDHKAEGGGHGGA